MVVDIPDGSDISSAEESGNEDDFGFEIPNENREKRGVKRKQNENIEWNKGELSNLINSFEDDAMQLNLFDSKSKPIDIFAYLFSEDLVNELVLQSNLFKHQNNIKNDDLNF